MGSRESTKQAKVTKEHQAEAARLRKLWDAKRQAQRQAGEPIFSQAAFGEEFNIGNQAAVGFFINGKTPLSFKAASGFARGLGCKIGDFSPRLAAQGEVTNLVMDSGPRARGTGPGTALTLTTSPTAAETVSHLALYIRSMPPGNRVALGRQLDLFAQADDSAQVKAEIIALLTGAVDVEKNIGVDKHGQRYFKPPALPGQDQELPAQPGEDHALS